MKLTRRRIEVIIPGIVIVFGFGWAYWNYLYKPVVTELKICKAEFESKKTEVQKLKVLPMVLERETREFQTKKLELERVKDRLPKEKEIPSLLKSITLTAQYSGIDFLSFIPDKLIEGEVYNEFPIQVEIKGRYHDIGNFLAGIGNLERVVVPSNLRLSIIKPTLEEPYTVATSMTLSTYVYIER